MRLSALSVLVAAVAAVPAPAHGGNEILTVKTTVSIDTSSASLPTGVEECDARRERCSEVCKYVKGYKECLKRCHEDWDNCPKSVDTIDATVASSPAVDQPVSITNQKCEDNLRNCKTTCHYMEHTPMAKCEATCYEWYDKCQVKHPYVREEADASFIVSSPVEEAVTIAEKNRCDIGLQQCLGNCPYLGIPRKDCETICHEKYDPCTSKPGAAATAPQATESTFVLENMSPAATGPFMISTITTTWCNTGGCLGCCSIGCYRYASDYTKCIEDCHKTCDKKVFAEPLEVVIAVGDKTIVDAKPATAEAPERAIKTTVIGTTSCHTGGCYGCCMVSCKRYSPEPETCDGHCKKSCPGGNVVSEELPTKPAGQQVVINVDL